MAHKQFKSVALRLIVIMLMVVVTAGFRAAPASAQYFENVIVPFEMAVDNECALGGSGEVVFLTGEMHILYFEIPNGRDGIVVKAHFQPVNVSGVGSITGATYRAVGLTQDRMTISPNVQTYSYVNVYNLIAEGSTENLIIHDTFHVTYDENGVPKVSVENSFSECR